ncbi:MAG TPA: alanine racemase [Drouetiella sp.]|jgi:alanine racemase
MLASRQLTVSPMCRDAWVEIDLARIEFNVKTIKSWFKEPQTELMAVVKSDGYGHGAAEVGRAALAAGAGWLAVATVDEGVELRAQECEAPILILGPAPARAIATAVENRLDLTLTGQADLDAASLAAKQINRNVRVHLKIDTGMHRLGAAPDDIEALVQQIVSRPDLELVSVFSHLAKADQYEFTKKQNDCFTAVVQNLSVRFPNLLKKQGGPVLAHLASGDAARHNSFTQHDMVRAGLNLYGLEARTISDVVKPAMAIRARINSLREIDPGETVGYNMTWTAKTRSRIASIPVGYADGIDRGLSNRMEGIIHGKRVKQAGLISMDQMLFDVTDVPESAPGDTLTLIGTDGEQSIQLADWANMLDTITYELACRMRVRLPRIYTHGQVVQT